MDFRLDPQTILAIVWFFIGFGAGFAVLRFWKILLAVLILALLIPIVMNLAGLRSPVAPKDIVNAFFTGLNMFATLIASNQFSTIGFILGVVVGVLIFVLRGRG